MITAQEREAIEMLLYLASTTDRLADNSCDEGSGRILVQPHDINEVSGALDELDTLPDDRPGMTLGPAGKAQWALRRLLAPQSAIQTLAARMIEHGQAMRQPKEPA